jgi:hypothetical protein
MGSERRGGWHSTNTRTTALLPESRGARPGVGHEMDHVRWRLAGPSWANWAANGRKEMGQLFGDIWREEKIQPKAARENKKLFFHFQICSIVLYQISSQSLNASIYSIILYNILN